MKEKKYQYVLLEKGETVQMGDEWLDGDETWRTTLDAGKHVLSGIYRRRVEVETTPQRAMAWNSLV